MPEYTNDKTEGLRERNLRGGGGYHLFVYLCNTREYVLKEKYKDISSNRLI